MFIRKYILLLCLAVGLSAFAGCGKNIEKEEVNSEVSDIDDDKEEDKKQKDKKDDDKNQDKDVNEEKSSENDLSDKEKEDDTTIVDMPKNPLKDYSTIYPGDFKEDDEETIKLIDCFLETCPGDVPELETILGVTAADFDGNGTSEAFIFAGTQDELGYYGSFYFVDGKTTISLGKDGIATDNIESLALYDFDGFKKFGNKIYYFFNEYYATARLTYVFEVVDGIPEESYISRLGDISFGDNDEFSIMDSSYDMTFDKSMGSYLGHTWKMYYFKYDVETDEIYECSGSHISINDIDDAVGFSITEQLEKEGYAIIDAYKRSNNLVEINLFMNKETSIDFYNISYDTKNKKFYGGWDNANGTEDWKNAVAEGSYSFALSDLYENTGADVYENIEIEIKNSEDIYYIMEEPYIVLCEIDGTTRLFYIDTGVDVSKLKGAGKYKIEAVNNLIKKIK